VPRPTPDACAVFSLVERGVAIVIGVILSIAVVLALTGGVLHAWNGLKQWPQLRSLFGLVDSVLFVLMLLEILQTVRSTLESHELAAEPFLIVGLIAIIRRILVVALETSDQPASQPVAGSALSFEQAMIELAVLAALMLVLAVAIYLLRQAKGSARPL